MRTFLIKLRVHLTFLLLGSFVIGTFLRLQQISSQVLEGDEWHPVHQLTYYTPGQIIKSLGNADYSIPLVLFYWLQMKWFGISELTLRLPMIIAGLLTIIIMPIALYRRLNDRIITLFALLLAISPFLISYSRIARPYAITLIGIYVSFWCFEQSIENQRIHWVPAAFYAILCGLIIWTHAITGPMLVAPLIILWCKTLRGKGPKLSPLILWTVFVTLVIAIAILPPLLGDPSALSGKLGIDNITLKTVYGSLFLWFGTGSITVIIVCLFFAGVGWTTIWEKIPIARWATFGIFLTAMALLITKPWWVDRPLAFGRYLLPAVPLLLLAISSGIVRVSDNVRKRAGNIGSNSLWTLIITVPFLISCWMTSPIPDILHYPNSYTQHPYFQLNYRHTLNWVRIELNNLSTSPFWSSLSHSPPGSLKIAVMPFRYATYEWPSPIWERESRQHVVPAYLWGACEQTRHGEVPPDPRFHFRNAVHVKNKDHLLAKGINYLAYYRPLPRKGWSPLLPHCESWMCKHYGPVDYEDPEFLVWRIHPGVPLPTNRK